MSADNQGNLFLCGDNGSGMIIAGHTLTVGTSQNFFLVKYRYTEHTGSCYHCPTTGVPEIAATFQHVSVCPAPTYGSCTVHCALPPSPGGEVIVYDVTGRRVAGCPLHASDTFIPLKVSPGICFCRIFFGDGEAGVAKKIVVE
jgi:hypothetical protein